jgi:UDP-glucose 4-epimerase
MTKIKTVLITGGAGFIGSHLCSFLIKKNFRVIVIDNLIYGRKENVEKKVLFIKGDIRNKNFLLKNFKNVDAVIHLAAMSRSGPSEIEMDFCFDQNTIGTKNVLEACRINKVKKLIYAGSATFYGNSPIKHKETYKGDFFNPYSLSKYFGEQLCLYYNKKKYVKCNVVRYFNVYGERQPTKGIYALVIGIFLDCKKRKQPLTIFGNGNQKRDFIHVDDVVVATYKALISNINGQIFNVGSGKSHSINYIAKLISENVVYKKKRKGEAKETLADISKINKKLRWLPKIQIEKGIKNLISKN